MNTNIEKKTNTIRIPIGDEGGDGHGHFVDYFFTVNSKFTEEMLTENYKKTRDLLGFGIRQIGDDLDNPWMTLDQLHKIIDLGLPAMEQSADWTIGELLEYSEEQEAVDISSEYLAELGISMCGYGLEGFSFEYAAKPDFSLFSGYSEDMDYNVGYGIMSPF